MPGSAGVDTVVAGEGGLIVHVVAERAVWTLSALAGQPPVCPNVVALVLATSGVAAGRVAPLTYVPPIRTPEEALNKCGGEV